MGITNCEITICGDPLYLLPKMVQPSIAFIHCFEKSIWNVIFLLSMNFFIAFLHILTLKFNIPFWQVPSVPTKQSPGKLSDESGLHSQFVSSQFSAFSTLSFKTLAGQHSPKSNLHSAMFVSLLQKPFPSNGFVIRSKNYIAVIQLSHMPPPNTRGADFESLVSD